MGKASKWLRSFLIGKKEKERQKEKCSTNHNSSTTDPENPTSSILVPPATPKDKKRWSFRRSHATAPAAKDLSSTEPIDIVATPPIVVQAKLDSDDEQKKHAMAMAKATAAAADAALAAAQAAAAVVQLTASANERANAIEEAAAATKIQSAFRSYLARKALFALRGLVKLQALVRGHLVRKQATATLRCMQALITAQERARAQRMQAVEEGKPENHRPSSAHRRSTQDRLRFSYNDMDRGMEENIKIVEMDLGESKGGVKHRNSNSSRPPTARSEHRYSTHHAEHRGYSTQDDYQVSPSPSALTDMSPRGCSVRFKDYGFSTAQSSPQCYSLVSKLDSAGHPFAFPPQEYTESLPYDYSLFPNYMANTKSSRAKARSQSAPKQRTPDSLEKPVTRRRASMEGRNVPRAVRMQRSSSHVGATAQNYQYPWSIKLDRSSVSLVDSECGSTSTVLTNNYCSRSVAGYDSHGNRY